MKKTYLFIVLFSAFLAQAQQYPFWTQYRSNALMINPAITGTRKTVDVRATYRYQWTGFEGSPKTYGLSVHSRLYKGRLGLGGYYYSDQLGPSKFSAIALTAAFHLKFTDTELSFGINGSYNTQRIDPSVITVHNSQDAAITNINNTPKSKIWNGSAGVLYFNDRFHVGASMNNLFGTSYEFFPKNPKTRVGFMTTVPHYMVSFGYIWTGDSRFAWENNFLATVVPGTPMLFDYNLRVHVEETFFVGVGIRLKTAVTAQLGYTFKGKGQISYSYDYTTNRLRTYNYGSHEIMLVYSLDRDGDKRKSRNNRFQKQKFQYLL